MPAKKTVPKKKPASAKAKKPAPKKTASPKSRKKKIEYRVENIVASAALNVELDLYAIAREVPNVEYEPEQFPGAILKLKEPRITLLLFKNGKLICAGAKSESQVENAIYTAYGMVKHCIKK